MKLDNRPERKPDSQRLRWSSRSQRGELELTRLQGEAERCRGFVLNWETRVAELEELKVYQVGLAVSGAGMGDVHVPLTLTELEGRTRELMAYRQHLASIESKISALTNPTPLQAGERVERQNAIARLASERLGKDRQTDDLLKNLRQLLAERAALTAQMADALAAIDFTLVKDGLDASRFDDLLAALPSGLADASEGWTARFLGEDPDAKPYTAREQFLLRETLADNGICPVGGRVRLSDGDAHDLASKIRRIDADEGVEAEVQKSPALA